MALNIGYGWSHRSSQKKNIGFTGTMYKHEQNSGEQEYKQPDKVLQVMGTGSLLVKCAHQPSADSQAHPLSDSNVNTGFKLIKHSCLGLRSLCHQLRP